MQIIKVAIFDDVKSRRDMLAMLLNNTEGLTCVGVYEDCTNIVANLKNNVPDVILMDINMPNVDGIEGLQLVRKHFASVKVLMQTVFEDDDKIFAAIMAGAEGYLLKKTSPAKLIESIVEIMEGGAPMTPIIAHKLLQLFRNKKPFVKNNTFDLTKREQEILEYLVQGYSYKMISVKCNISYPTVNSHISHIYEKLHVSSNTEAVAKALANKG